MRHSSALVPSSLYFLYGGTISFAFQSLTPRPSVPLRHRVSATTPLGSITALRISRRDAVEASVAAVAGLIATPAAASAAAAVQETLDVSDFLRTGVDGGGNMGVSSQAGKSRPLTGVVLRDGTDVLQGRDGAVSAEILVGRKEAPTSVLVSFAAPYRLETGGVFDVECRDARTGDGAFLAVTAPVAAGTQLADLPASFFLERLFSPTGRFSFYGPPTDVRVKRSAALDGDRRLIELAFSNLSQSTNAEIPRRAALVATIPRGTHNAVMLVASSNASRWKKGGGEERAQEIIESFRAVPAPKSNMKLRAKDRTGGQSLEF